MIFFVFGIEISLSLFHKLTDYALKWVGFWDVVDFKVVDEIASRCVF